MTILPKKKVTKDKIQNDKTQGSHEHLSTQHHSQHSESVSSRARHETSQIRSTAHSSGQLDDRQHRTRPRHPPEFPVLANTENQASPLGPAYDTSVVDGATGVACGLVDPALQLHARVTQASSDISDVPPVVLNVPVPGESSVIERPAVVKRRHGRQSPHSIPYSRTGKNSRGSPTTPDNAGSSGMLAPASKHHGAMRRHHSVQDDRRPISPPVNVGLGTAARSTRRRQRSRAEGKEDKVEHNSDDEYDAARLRRLHQGVNFEELETKFAQALKEVRGFVIKETVEDGACLFRAVAEQVYGDQNMHDEVRRNCMDYMTKNSDFFSHYVTEDFVAYVTRKRLPHTHGNHLEMQAMAEMYNRNIHVYQYSTEPINTFQSSNITGNEPIRVSYHRNSHYNSVINPYKASVGVGLGLPSFHPGLADRKLLDSAQRASEQELLERQMLEDKFLATDWENTEDEMVREVAHSSLLQYLQHQEAMARAKKNTTDDSTETTEPTCSQEATSSQSATASALPNTEMAVKESNTAEDSSLAPSTSQASFPIFSNTGYSDWVDQSDESAVLAQVMAQSQREYYEALTKPGTSSTATCSKYPTDH
ncbi:uncharacterized protein LOC100187208 [Ciona intestinalis]